MTPTTKKERIDALAESSASDSGVSLAASAWKRLRRSPVFLLGAAIIALFLVVAAIAPWLAPHDPAARDLIDQVIKARNQIPGPQEGYPLGGDLVGRDLLSRLLVGAQQTLLVGVFATLIGLAGGMVLGILAGAFGGWVDSLVMRVVDVMLSIPQLLLAFGIGALFARPSLLTVILAVSIVQIPVFARLLRGSMLAQRSSDHVLAATALGVKPGPIVFRHMLPNSLGPVIVQSTLVLATSIIDAAALSFLGLGNPDDTIPEWGQMLGSAQTVIDSHPHLAFWPAGCIIVIALGFTLVGESLRDALDPKNRR
ncbi:MULTISPECIES: ABC transporter permease [Actinosynnema]|uniref:Binding-protein-dependent transport systems inner membrane component n=2 Tax=Actinosynnema TaxID=40566 RepID=C6WF47_ACTMD|nr:MULTISPECIES: ABC transporter permease [Actinosynnema]ACU34179.1 binding-protein-dependent transport systems inner membrane component [Actinosynnema mirum DSM 43827]AXX27552.1 Dipeptide transport system permease protein DppC [Actinosynnema pretiosum subsp. pretiosum]MCP2097009.1 peptide/nickel transport system permease protein [Actinosynnema pretiosum]QUF01739.1 ABC transporter permease [Actinosynnema pretiosum subsp. pretiosum]